MADLKLYYNHQTRCYRKVQVSDYASKTPRQSSALCFTLLVASWLLFCTSPNVREVLGALRKSARAKDVSRMVGEWQAKTFHLNLPVYPCYKTAGLPCMKENL